jgi:hypothetical protein
MVPKLGALRRGVSVAGTIRPIGGPLLRRLVVLRTAVPSVRMKQTAEIRTIPSPRLAAAAAAGAGAAAAVALPLPGGRAG